MGDNLGRAVKWQNPGDQGWHTGRIVLDSNKEELVVHSFRRDEVLVRESCDGKLSWVYPYLLQDWQPRSEREDKVDSDAIAALLGNAARAADGLRSYDGY